MMVKKEKNKEDRKKRTDRGREIGEKEEVH